MIDYSLPSLIRYWIGHMTWTWQLIRQIGFKQLLSNDK